MARAGHVYVMDAGDGRLKVGCSKSPIKRSSDLGALPILYESLWVARAQLVEKRAHAVLKAQGFHVDGELFSATLEQAIAAVEEVLALDEAGQLKYKPANRKRKPVTWSLDRDLVEELEDWIAEQPFKVSKSRVIERAIITWLDEQEAADQQPHRPRRSGKGK